VRRGKVLVVGAAEAGKSTLIKSLAPEAINLEVDGRTIAMDHGMLRRAECSLSLVGVPGQRRFAPVREILATGAVCAVWVHRPGEPVDAATSRLVSEIGATGVPYVVFVNQDDHSVHSDGWRTPSECREPAAVVVGNATRRDGRLADLENEVWSFFD
jgi:signal recognition particle receptor subunit beta